MAFVNVAGGQVFYEVQGRGEPLLILRGLGRSSRYWLGFDEVLSKKYMVITVDFRSIGRTTARFHWTQSIDHLADDLNLVLKFLRIDRCHIFGLSLGGMVAMSFAARYPASCKTLTVANSSSADYLGMRINPVALAKVGLSLFKGNVHEELVRLVTNDKIQRTNGQRIAVEWEQIRRQEGFPLLTIAKQVLAAARFRIKGKLNPAELPMMFIFGEDDSLVPPKNTQTLHKLFPGAVLQKISGVGHEISIGAESRLIEILQEFIERSRHLQEPTGTS